MSSLTTPVQGWPMPSDADSPQVASDMRLLATALDVVPKRLSGLASARPLASATPVDTIYYATDTGVYSISTGAAWGTMLVAGTWTALTLSTNIGVGFGPTPSARLEGDCVRLKGQPQNNTGSTISSGTQIATIPVGMRQAAGLVDLPACVSGALPTNPSYIQITTAGVVNYIGNNGIANGQVIFLDGLTYSLS